MPQKITNFAFPRKNFAWWSMPIPKRQTNKKKQYNHSMIQWILVWEKKNVDKFMWKCVDCFTWGFSAVYLPRKFICCCLYACTCLMLLEKAYQTNRQTLVHQFEVEFHGNENRNRRFLLQRRAGPDWVRCDKESANERERERERGKAAIRRKKKWCNRFVDIESRNHVLILWLFIQ